MLNVTKKAAAVLLIFILSVMCNSCRYETRVDFSELIRRLNLGTDTYKADIENSFYSEGEWFLFTDTISKSDMLITAKEDEDRILHTASVSIINNGTEKQKEIFSDFCIRLTNAFTENADSEKIIADSRIGDTDLFFSDGAYFSENGRFQTSLYSSETGCSFIISAESFTNEAP